MTDVNSLSLRLDKRFREINQRLNRQAERLETLETSAVNQAARISALEARTQRVNQSVGPLTANVPLDVIVTWPNPWPDAGYGIYTQITSGNLVLGAVHATPKANTKTTTGCVVTVESTVDVASIGLDVRGDRT